MDENKLIEELEATFGDLGQDFSVMKITNKGEPKYIGFKKPSLAVMRVYKDSMSNEFIKASSGKPGSFFKHQLALCINCLIGDNDKLVSLKDFKELAEVRPALLDKAAEHIEKLNEESYETLKKA